MVMVSLELYYETYQIILPFESHQQYKSLSYTEESL